MDALYSLRRRGLATLAGGSLYQLTGRGFKIAQALKKQEQNVTEQTEKPLPPISLNRSTLVAYLGSLSAMLAYYGSLQMTHPR
jgi:hypothetical protein